MSGPFHVTDTQFDTEVIESPTPVLVDFWAEWCGPCRVLSPALDELASELADKVKVVKVNIDQNPEVPSKMGVTSIPTLVVFKEGKAVSMKAGALPKNALKEWVESLL